MNIKNQTPRFRSGQEGQGFMEVIVAFGIMVIGIVAILILTSFNLASADYGEKRLIASNLAREALEGVRHIRDSNWLAGNDWDNGFPTVSNETYQILNLTSDSSGIVYSLADDKAIDTCVNCALLVNGPIFAHTLVGGSPSGFKRIVEFETICSDSLDAPESLSTMCIDVEVGVAVTARVQWQASNGEIREVAIEDRLFNWR